MMRRWCVRFAIVVSLLMAVLGAESKSATRARRAAAITRLPEAVTAEPPNTVLVVAAVDRDAQPAVQAAARRIDELLAADWEVHGVKPSRPLADDAFVRRIYLELAGRIPSYDEAVAFLDSKCADKRTDLIDTLLESPDYVSHFYNYWADVLRLSERPQKRLPFEPYLHYVKEAIRTNRHYDEWVHEMLTANGRLWENPAVGFQLRDDGMPLPYVDNTVRVLLGTQIGCAQCHDHPFDHWTQHQFYELAAFTAGTKSRPGQGPANGKRNRSAVGAHVRSLVKEAREKEARNTAAITQFILANATAVRFADQPLSLPHDYQYPDAEPLSLVAPKVLWGEVPTEARSADGRQQFAAWIVSHDNRQFARTIANRLWKKVMGVGLVEPVDDFREGNPPSHPELLEHLTDEMVRLDFDLREFVRVLVSTEVYQRRAVIHDPSTGVPFRFAGPALRRMTAEQLWDSILTLVARNSWTVQRPTAAEIAASISIDLPTATLADVERQFALFMDRYSPQRYQQSIRSTCGYHGLALMKASEMPAPLPLSHFLRQFGQSDRESIEGGRTVATIPQILAMFNGPITHSMLERGSVIYDNVTSRNAQEAVDVVFLSVLTHRPSVEDRRLAIEEITTADDRRTGCGNVIWALLNTREFIFIQ